jgi:hypothetical protein
VTVGHFKYNLAAIHILYKGKRTVQPRAGHERPEMEQRCSSTLSLTWALEGVGGQRHAPAALPLGKTHYLLYGRLGGPQGRIDGCGKSCPHRDSISGLFSP